MSDVDDPKARAANTNKQEVSANYEWILINHSQTIWHRSSSLHLLSISLLFVLDDFEMMILKYINYTKDACRVPPCLVLLCKYRKYVTLALFLFSITSVYLIRRVLLSHAKRSHRIHRYARIRGVFNKLTSLSNTFFLVLVDQQKSVWTQIWNLV